MEYGEIITTIRFLLYFSCDVCGMKFSQLGSWMGHKDTHKDKSETNHECDVCGKIFSQKVGLLNHKKRHTSEKKVHNCKTCHLNFFSAGKKIGIFYSHAGMCAGVCALVYVRWCMCAGVCALVYARRCMHVCTNCRINAA